MKFYFFILAFITFIHVKAQTILLTPILPPSAFQNQFYQVRFRARTLVGTVFEFKNVPSFFTASSAGLLSGIPTKQGLYAIQVVYSTDSYKGSQQVIIQVRRGTKLTNYNNQKETQQIAGPDNSLKPKEQFLYTYQQNDELNIQINVTNGIPPLTFQPIYIPSQVKFDNKTGNIYGSFYHFGDYIFGLKVKDSLNKQIQILIKVSIVNVTATAPKFIFYRRSSIEVDFNSLQIQPVKNNTFNSSNNNQSISQKLNQTKNTQTKSIQSQTSAVGGGSINIPTNPQPITNPQKQITNNQIPKVGDKLTSPTNKDTTVSKNSTSEAKIPQEIVKLAQKDTSTQQIVSTKQLISKNITTQINKEQIQTKKTQLTKKLQASKQELKVCYQNVQVSRKTVQNFHTIYNDQNAKVQKLKDQLQSLRTKSQRVSTDLTQKLDTLKVRQIQKRLAQQEYNKSRMSFDNVNYAYNGSLENIKQNSELINKIQTDIQSNKRELDRLYKLLDESMSLSQKLDEEKKKINEDIKKSYGIFAKISASKADFGGCDNSKFYSKSTGVGQVKRTLDKMYILTNNQLILYGDCSDHQPAKPGDFITWKGYLTNGVVSALTLKKLN